MFSRLADFEGWFDFTVVGNDSPDQKILAMEQRNAVVSASSWFLRLCMQMHNVTMVITPGTKTFTPLRHCRSTPALQSFHGDCDGEFFHLACR